MTPITIEHALELAIGHHQAGRLGEAEALYRRILGQVPDHPDALHLLGALACQTGHPGPAIELIGRAIARNPAVAEYHAALGEAYRRAGEAGTAIAHFQRALALKPGLAVAHGNLGVALAATGRLPDAIAAFRRSLSIDPKDAVVHANLGLALMDSGRIDEAIAAYEAARALDPKNPITERNLGVALHRAGRSEQAIAAYRRALALKGDDAKTQSNLGMTLHEMGRIDEALVVLGQAIRLGPHLGESYNHMGNALRDAGRLNEAIAAYRQGLALRANQGVTYDNLLFALHFHPDHDAQAILAEHRRWAAEFAAPLAAEIRPHNNDRSPERKLRIGFVSPDFRDHPVGRLLTPLFAHHDRRQAEFIAYSGVRCDDAITREFEALADGWRSIAGQGDAEVAERIRHDRIDVLVDLAQHTAGNRLLVFARKPAPVQVSMLGMPTTTGLSTIDYRLTDPYLDPPGVGGADYSEQSIRLPHTFWCYYPAHDSPPVATTLPEERKGFVTFGCLNQFAKLSPPVLRLWASILESLPGTRLVLHAPAGTARDAVRGIFQGAGIAPERIEFDARVSLRDYLWRYQDIDLCLDPFPYHGGTTTMDALWMGVPVITLAGRTAVGRSGVSILSNAGLAELVARTPEEYAALARAWAADRARRAALRAELRPRMQASPLRDGRAYAADVEDALRQAWRKWCTSWRP